MSFWYRSLTSRLAFSPAGKDSRSNRAQFMSTPLPISVTVRGNANDFSWVQL